MTCIEAEQECSAAFSGILYDLLLGFSDSSGHSFVVCIVVALDLVFADVIGFDALLKLASPSSDMRYVRILEFVG